MHDAIKSRSIGIIHFITQKTSSNSLHQTILFIDWSEFQAKIDYESSHTNDTRNIEQKTITHKLNDTYYLLTLFLVSQMNTKYHHEEINAEWDWNEMLREMQLIGNCFGLWLLRAHKITKIYADKYELIRMNWIAESPTVRLNSELIVFAWILVGLNADRRRSSAYFIYLLEFSNKAQTHTPH